MCDLSPDSRYASPDTLRQPMCGLGWLQIRVMQCECLWIQGPWGVCHRCPSMSFNCPQVCDAQRELPRFDRVRCTHRAIEWGAGEEKGGERQRASGCRIERPAASGSGMRAESSERTSCGPSVPTHVACEGIVSGVGSQSIAPPLTHPPPPVRLPQVPSRSRACRGRPAVRTWAM